MRQAANTAKRADSQGELRDAVSTVPTHSAVSAAGAESLSTHAHIVIVW